MAIKFLNNSSVTGQLTVTNGIEMTSGNFNAGDNERIRLGNSADLQIYHDGSDSYIDDTGTGWLRLRGNGGVILSSYSEGEIMLQATRNGAVSLYYDNARKFQTTSGGVAVTGDVNTSGNANINGGNITINGSYPRFNMFSNDAGEDDWSIINNNGIFGIYNNTAAAYALSISETVNTVIINSGNIQLNGTGRITGVDTVSSATDAANKLYVDNAVAGVPIGNYLPLTAGSGSPLTGDLYITKNSPVLTITDTVASDLKLEIKQSGSTSNFMSRGGTSSKGQFNFRITDGSTVTNALFINQQANVGIGTTSPGYPLEISNNAITSLVYQRTGVSANKWGFHSDNDATYWQNVTSGSLLFTLQNGGNVGIGTTSPGEKLTVIGKALLNNGSSLYVDSAATQTVFANIANIPMRFQTNSANRLTIGSTGVIQFNNYNSTNNIGTPTYLLGTDASGNIVKTNTVPGSAAGPYLPLVAGSGNGLTGLLLFTGTTDANRKIFFTNAGAYAKGSIDAASYAFQVSGSEKLTIDSSGNVGIGTTSPYNKTHITTSVDGDGLLLDYAGSNNKYVGVFFKIDNNTSDAYKKGALVWERTGSYNEGRFHFLLNNDDNASNVDLTDSKVTILSTGNVGIGTTSPSQKLDVNGNAYISGQAQASTAVMKTYSGHAMFGSNSTAEPIALGRDGANLDLVVATNGNVGIGTTSPSEKLEVQGGNIKIDTTTNVDAKLILNPYSSALGTAYQWELVGASSSQNYNFQIREAGQAYVTVDSSVSGNAGYVGIGTTSPGAKLEVSNGSSGYSGAYNGRTSAVFEGNNSGGNTISIMSPSTGYSGLFFGNETTETLGQIHFKHSENAFTFVNGGGNERMRINSAGNVGIGTTAPEAKLDVNGGGIGNTSGDIINAAIFTGGRQRVYFQNKRTADGSDWNNNTFKILAKIDSTSHQSIDFVNDASYNEHIDIYTGNQVFNTRFNSNGNVGIGVTNPNTKLHVGGIVQVTESGNTAFYGGNYLRVFNSQVYTMRNSAGSQRFAFDNSSGSLSTYNSSNIRTTYLNNAGSSYFNGGNVGINTTSPSSSNMLEVNGQVRVDGAQMIGDSSTSNVVATGVQLHIKNTGEAKIRLEDSDSSNLAFDILVNEGAGFSIKETVGGDSGDDTRLFIQETTGNVGIGTTSPQSPLHIYKSLSGGVGGELRLDNNNSAVANKTRILFSDGSGASSSSDRGAIVCETEASPYMGQLQFQTGVGAISTKMIILGNGNVGIGETTPTSKLEVRSETATHQLVSLNRAASPTAAMYLGNDSGNNAIISSNYSDLIFGRDQSSTLSEWMRIKRDGNVGIGANNPLRKLHVVGNFAVNAGTGEYYGVNITGGESANPNILIGDWHNSSANIGWNSAGNYLRIDSQHGTNGAPIVFSGNDSAIEYMRITSAGDVGIGSTAPQARLDVQPTASNRKVTRIANDVMSTYFYNTQADAVLAWTCGSYHQAEVVITANQTNGGDYNNIYIRGIWSNNHTSHHWDELERVGSLSGSTFTMSVGQNGATENSGRLELDFNYINASFSQLNVRVTDFYGTHSYTIT